jgi:predicted glycoside hydrolase/deacetylase ChbG (UPF0249 family)
MNPVLKQLGFDARDRVLIVHADDIGMCQATLPAIEELFEFGLVTSAATMVPCPWFPQTAAFCREHPSIDMGVHLTVNCEWESYRWGAISTCDPASGMLDEQGYLHAWPPAIHERADPQAVAVELRAQVARALAAGIDATHVDAHMGTVLAPQFVQSYIDVAQEHQLPLLFLGRDAAERIYGSSEDTAYFAPLWQDLEARGVALFDDIGMLPLDDPTDHVAVMKRSVDNLQPGLTVLILHPAQDTPELRAIAPDWRSRVANYQACLSEELRNYVRQAGVQLIGYRPLRDALRASR